MQDTDTRTHALNSHIFVLYYRFCWPKYKKTHQSVCQTCWIFIISSKEKKKVYVQRMCQYTQTTSLIAQCIHTFSLANMLLLSTVHYDIFPCLIYSSLFQFHLNNSTENIIFFFIFIYRLPFVYDSEWTDTRERKKEHCMSFVFMRTSSFCCSTALPLGRVEWERKKGNNTNSNSRIATHIVIQQMAHSKASNNNRDRHVLHYQTQHY